MSNDFFEDTVELPFKGHAPTPQMKQQIIDEFIRRALDANPAGTVGEPEHIQSCLVTGQSFAMTLRIGLVQAVKAVSPSERSSEGNRQHRPKGPVPSV